MYFPGRSPLFRQAEFEIVIFVDQTIFIIVYIYIHIYIHIYISLANALELRQYFKKPSIYVHIGKYIVPSHQQFIHIYLGCPAIYRDP